MSQDQKDAIIGRLLRERKEVQSHLAKLKADAGKISQKFEELGEMLDRNPQDVWFHGELARIKDCAPRSKSFNIADFDIQRIIDLTDEIRTAQGKLDGLNSEASKLGF